MVSPYKLRHTRFRKCKVLVLLMTVLAAMALYHMGQEIYVILCTRSRVRGLLQGCLRHVQEDGNAVYETLQEIKGDMIIAGLKFNKTTHTLFVEVYLLTGQVEVRHLSSVNGLYS